MLAVDIVMPTNVFILRISAISDIVSLFAHVYYSHAVFYSAASSDVFKSFKVREEELPTVYMLSEDEEGLLPYQGEILEMNLSEWVLRNSAPAMGELTFAQPAGTILPANIESYDARFYSTA